ncbi:MAG: bifunctional phosphoribosylaminoimidazolecarboxamide formyltransferase/IMP cyclohydrolase [Flavobacteriaceae bacterium]|nr:bifunctional phosphoribosylaminoimidazolecarboxamide formyltransferase/IMP cyclohydrolase [Flavobacteriaceae bacterium]
MASRTIQSALISVFDKGGLAPIVQKLHQLNVSIYSTGGTKAFIEDLGIPVISVESVTEYPSIFGGRVKTLHPKIFGGILNRQSNPQDQAVLGEYAIPQLDLVIVDLYPFEDTVAEGKSHPDIIEKIDIGGISLIRAAAKNYEDTLCIASKNQYDYLLDLLHSQGNTTQLEQRKAMAKMAFMVSSHYDTHIYRYFNENQESLEAIKLSLTQKKALRYGENPHQQGAFFGDFDALLEQLHGKALSYNNLLDVDAAINLMQEFQNEAPTFGIFKHNNACGFAQRESLHDAHKDALAGDPVSAFGGVLIANTPIDDQTAQEIHKLFCEVVIAPDFETEALQLLTQKKNRIVLKQKQAEFSKLSIRTALNGFLVQEKDHITDTRSLLTTATKRQATEVEIDDLLFASKICKHTKSNTIILCKNRQLLAGGTGQTSRVDALQQAIHKAKSFGFDLKDAVMASDAFFPFPDCVEIAYNEGIKSVIQPGGSIKDQDSIDFCDRHDIAMLFTGVRHFKH